MLRQRGGLGPAVPLHARCQLRGDPLPVARRRRGPELACCKGIGVGLSVCVRGE